MTELFELLHYAEEWRANLVVWRHDSALPVRVVGWEIVAGDWRCPVTEAWPHLTLDEQSEVSDLVATGGAS